MGATQVSKPDSFKHIIPDDVLYVRLMTGGKCNTREEMYDWMITLLFTTREYVTVSRKRVWTRAAV